MRFRPVGRLSWPVIASLVIIGLLLAVALLAGSLVPDNPMRQQIAKRLLPPFWAPGGSLKNLLGTDQLGRDVLSRIIYGTRASLLLGMTSVLLAMVVGTSLGMLMGYSEGRISLILLRITDVQLAFPFLVLAIAIVALFGASFFQLVAVLVLWAWPSFARLARAQVLVEKEKEYIVAARAVGASSTWIITRGLLPNILSPLMVLSTLTLAQMIIFESALSFLGFGVPPPSPSWGSMLSDGRDYVGSAWWLITFPGLALMLAVLAFNTLGDYLQDRSYH
jgi:peptide/nickel transport system permease protein